MTYAVGLLLCLTLGYLTLHLIIKKPCPFILHMLLALSLGFGLIGQITFYSHIVCNQFNHTWLINAIVMLSLLLLSIMAKDSSVSLRTLLFKDVAVYFKKNTISKQDWVCLFTLLILAIPLVLEALHYPLGGWDAWSCWNLKAKFIFLGQEHWADMLHPSLWRSNTHYPLLLPLIHVWFWDLSGRFNQAIPMINSITFTLLAAGILLFSLRALTQRLWLPIAATVAIFAIPFFITLAISQYSDILLALFLLSALTCFLLAPQCQSPQLNILSMIFLGFLSFTKPEGLVAALIAATMILWANRYDATLIKRMMIALLASSLPTIIFWLYYAPPNEAFINGLTSTTKPSNLARLTTIAFYPLSEWAHLKWHGLWILGLGAAGVAGKRLWQGRLAPLGLFLVAYLLMVLAYYQINTFFEIRWWLDMTLSRILFALMPSIGLWIVCGYAFKKDV